MKTSLRHRSIAYCLDAAVLGVYLWLGAMTLRLGGCAIAEDDSYPFTMTVTGAGIMLPQYRVFSMATRQEIW